MPTHLCKSGLPARTEREFGTTLVATAQRASLARSWLHSALTIHSSRRRFAARLNSRVRPLQRKALAKKHLRHRQLVAGHAGHVLRQLRSRSTRLKAPSSATPSRARLLRKRARIVHCIPGHRLRAGQSAGPPLWTWLVRKGRKFALHSVQVAGNSSLAAA